MEAGRKVVNLMRFRVCFADGGRASSPFSNGLLWSLVIRYTSDPMLLLGENPLLLQPQKPIGLGSKFGEFFPIIM